MKRSEYIGRIKELLYEHPGVNLEGYREKTLERRIAARQHDAQIDDEERYLRLLRVDMVERQKLVDTIGIQVSSFFRNFEPFEFLDKKILPVLLENKRTCPTRQLRAWSAGCAGGEEAYTLAILFAEALRRHPLPGLEAMIFATDVNAGALESASKGRYAPTQFDEMPLELAERYFEKVGSLFEVDKRIRAMVSFSWDDLTVEDRIAPEESVFGGFDLVTCRNVFIYYDAEVQERVLKKIYRAMSPGGYLLLGDSEGFSLPGELGFREIDLINNIWKKTGGPC